MGMLPFLFGIGLQPRFHPHRGFWRRSGADWLKTTTLGRGQPEEVKTIPVAYKTPCFRIKNKGLGLSHFFSVWHRSCHVCLRRNS
jgi:hypothetical protein